MKQIDRLLLFQGHRCFFCDEPIPEGEASVEHLVASKNGGGNGDDNCVVCCKTLNTALGHLSYKEKLRAILNHRPRFTCPLRIMSSSADSQQMLPFAARPFAKPTAPAVVFGPPRPPAEDILAADATPPEPVDFAAAKVTVVLEFLDRLRSARPRRVASLRNIISGAFLDQITDHEIDEILADLIKARHVIISETKVSYSTPVKRPEPVRKKRDRTISAAIEGNAPPGRG